MAENEQLQALSELAVEHVFPLQIADGSTFGITKRDLFAAMAMQGLIANVPWEQNHACSATARESLEYADALLKELAK